MLSISKANAALRVHKERQEAMRREALGQGPQPRVRSSPVQADATPKLSSGHPQPCPQSSLQAGDELARQLAAVAAAVDAIGRRLAARGHAGVAASHTTQQQHPTGDGVPQAMIQPPPKDNPAARHLYKQRQDRVVSTSDAVDRREDDEDEDANAPWPVPRVIWVEATQEPTPADAPPPVFWWE